VLQLRYPQHRPLLTPARVTYIKENHCRLITGKYTEELREYQSWDTLEARVARFQLPYTEKDVPVLTPEDLARRTALRQEQGERLKVMAKEKRETKMRALCSQARALLTLETQAKASKGRELAAVLERLAAVGVTDVKAVGRVVSGLVRQVIEIKARHQAKGFEMDAELAADIAALPPPEDEKEDAKESYPLLLIPDDKLSSQELQEKRMQKMRKGAGIAREKDRIKKQEEAEVRRRQRELDEAERASNPTRWLETARLRRAEYIARRESRRKSKVAANERRSEAASDRMKAIISTISGSQEKKKTADGCADDGSDFGDKDEDWNVYRQIAKEDDGDDSDDDVKVAELDAQILELDPTHIPAGQELDAMAAAHVPTKRDFQLCLGTELIQTGEVLFQPALVGLEHPGLSELIFHTLQRFSREQRQQMVSNVVLCGGGVMIPGFAQRIQGDLGAMLPSGTVVRIIDVERDYTRPGPFGGMGGAVSGLAWRGASRFSACPDFHKVCVTKAEWEEKGPSYLFEHRCANRWIPAIPSDS